jgi:hypothetical protein
MMKFGIATGLVVASAMSVAAFAVAGTAVPAKIVAFTGTYTGTATVQVNDSQVANISATGKGTGTILGASKISGTGTGNAAVQPCVPFSGPGTLTAANGTKLVFTVASGSQGCGDEQGEIFSISGKATVTKGTLKLAKAHGTLKVTGVYDHTAGTFSVKFKGNLTIPA